MLLDISAQIALPGITIALPLYSDLESSAQVMVDEW